MSQRLVKLFHWLSFDSFGCCLVSLRAELCCVVPQPLNHSLYSHSKGTHHPLYISTCIVQCIIVLRSRSSSYMPLRDRFKSFHSSSDPTDPHEWKLPQHFPTASSTADQPQVPDVSVFKDLSAKDSIHPTAGELAVHLCLLECFQRFKQDAIRSASLDIAFQGLIYTGKGQASWEDEEGGNGETSTHQNEDEAGDYERQKWSLVVSLAVARFEAWWRKIEGIIFHAVAYAPYPQSSRQASFTKDYLPPLDVLLVWYSSVLNSRDSDIECAHSGKQELFSLALPWKAIHQAIDRETFT